MIRRLVILAIIILHMPMLLFQHTEPPPHHRNFSRSHAGEWYTWSVALIKELPQLRKQMNRMGTVDFIYLKQDSDYNYSYNINLKKLDPGYLRHFRHFAYSLYHTDPGGEIFFFHGLIDRRVNGRVFHFLFALFRTLLTEITEDEMGALYSPLTAGRDESDFPLHCDLYIPRILFNVMEQPASDGSGHSTFLPVQTLFEQVLPGVAAMPAATRRYLKELVAVQVRDDNYDRFYNQLYDDAWAGDVKRRCRILQWKIRMRKGEGYMLNDRLWMHGRDKTYGGVPGKRLHRLIYNSFLENRKIPA